MLINALGITQVLEAAGGPRSRHFLQDFTCLYVPVSVSSLLLVWSAYWVIRLSFIEGLLALSNSGSRFALNLAALGTDFLGLLGLLCSVGTQVLVYYRLVHLQRLVESLRQGRMSHLRLPEHLLDFSHGFRAAAGHVDDARFYRALYFGDSQPLCVIESLSVDVRPFCEVSAEFAAIEGAGDGSLAGRLQVHRAYVSRECERPGRTFDERMPVAGAANPARICATPCHPEPTCPNPPSPSKPSAST